MSTRPVTLSFCGDVMLGRGVDQILPYPGDPTLREQYMTDARDYVDLARAVPRPVDFSWPWGESLRMLDKATPDVRIVNLETAVTSSDEFAPGKAVHYRMNPANLPCLTAARPDVCVLANNHVLDFGRSGLAETLDVLADARLHTTGAGGDLAHARQPAIVPVGDGRRVLVFALGAASSGIPASWAATARHAGVDVVRSLSEDAADTLVDRVQHHKCSGDTVVASLHWGSNWGYQVPDDQGRFAHHLIDGGVDIVHGHSSHHPRPIEVHRGKLILHGCGDFIDDYEGIAGHERYRDDLRLLYLTTVHPDTGRLADLRMVPLQTRRMRLQSASTTDAAWLRDLLGSLCVGADVDLDPDGVLALRP